MVYSLFSIQLFPEHISEFLVSYFGYVKDKKKRLRFYHKITIFKKKIILIIISIKYLKYNCTGYNYSLTCHKPVVRLRRQPPVVWMFHTKEQKEERHVTY